MKKVRAHLTYANVLSSLAIFLVLGGATAVAAKKTHKIGATQIKASAVTTAKIKNRAVVTAKIRDGAVSAEKLAAGAVGAGNIADGAVVTEKIANDAVTGDKVNESTLAQVPQANSANPGVFAKVNANGSVDPANSKGITSPNVVHPIKGIYCINVPAFVARGGQVTAHGTSEPAIVQLAAGGTGDCPAPAVQVSTWTLAGVLDNAAFYVELYR